jgi:WD40 repeat protein
VECRDPRAALFAAADGDGSVYLWNVASRSLVATFSGEEPVTAVALNPAGTLVAGGTVGGATYLWDVPAQQQVAVLRGYGSAVSAMAFSPDGAELAVGDKSVSAVWTISEQG